MVQTGEGSKIERIEGNPQGADPSQSLFDKTKVELEHWKQTERDVFIATPALKICQKKLRSLGHLNIFGLSGVGKTSLAYEILVRSGRQVIILRDAEQWEYIDITVEQLILIDDMLGRFELDNVMKNKWLPKLRNMFAATSCGQVQIIVTCRETVFSACRAELEQYQLFQRDSRVCLNDQENGCNLDSNLKLRMLKQYINSKYALANITICERKNEESLLPTVGNEHKISIQTLNKIAKMETTLGFPQCCRMFVSTPKCFAKGAKFFEQPTKMIIEDIERMYNSGEQGNEMELFNFCVLACILIIDKLKEALIDRPDCMIQDIAIACGISNVRPLYLSGKLKTAARRLSTSYINVNSTYTFKHNSLIEAMFSFLFKTQPILLIDNCNFDLLENLVSIAPSETMYSNCCPLVSDSCSESFCMRLIKEMKERGNVKRAVSHSVLKNWEFVEKLCSIIQTSDDKESILQCTENHLWHGDKSILWWSAMVTYGPFMSQLIRLLRGVMSASNMEEEGSKALEVACEYGNYDTYKVLVSEPDARVTAQCFSAAARSGSSRIVGDLLKVKQWDSNSLSDALIEACCVGDYATYHELVSQQNVTIRPKSLYMAAHVGNLDMVHHLLQVKTWNNKDIYNAVKTACCSGSYNTYKKLVSLVPEILPKQLEECMNRAEMRGNDQIVEDLRVLLKNKATSTVS
ncbi:hypothetical protein ScPMuIL_013831 [Solemya velum]